MMKTRATLRCRRTRRGQAVVEFALVLPVFLLLLFGALEFGRVFVRLHLMTNAAREGARVGSLPGSTEDDVQDTASDRMTRVGLSGDEFVTTVVAEDQDGVERESLAVAQQGDRIQVTVTHDFDVLVGNMIPGFSGTVPLHSGCTFRHE